jgi:hypothetical protein
MGDEKKEMTKSEASYIAHRADLLAQLVLTRRKDLEVIQVDTAADTGLDLFVRVHHPVM